MFRAARRVRRQAHRTEDLHGPVEDTGLVRVREVTRGRRAAGPASVRSARARREAVQQFDVAGVGRV